MIQYDSNNLKNQFTFKVTNNKTDEKIQLHMRHPQGAYWIESEQEIIKKQQEAKPS